MISNGSLGWFKGLYQYIFHKNNITDEYIEYLYDACKFIFQEFYIEDFLIGVNKEYSKDVVISLLSKRFREIDPNYFGLEKRYYTNSLIKTFGSIAKKLKLSEEDIFDFFLNLEFVPDDQYKIDDYFGNIKLKIRSVIEAIGEILTERQQYELVKKILSLKSEDESIQLFAAKLVESLKMEKKQSNSLENLDDLLKKTIQSLSLETRELWVREENCPQEVYETLTWSMREKLTIELLDNKKFFIGRYLSPYELLEFFTTYGYRIQEEGEQNLINELLEELPLRYIVDFLKLDLLTDNEKEIKDKLVMKIPLIDLIDFLKSGLLKDDEEKALVINEIWSEFISGYNKTKNDRYYGAETENKEKYQKGLAILKEILNGGFIKKYQLLEVTFKSISSFYDLSQFVDATDNINLQIAYAKAFPDYKGAQELLEKANKRKEEIKNNEQFLRAFEIFAETATPEQNERMAQIFNKYRRPPSRKRED